MSNKAPDLLSGHDLGDRERAMYKLLRGGWDVPIAMLYQEAMFDGDLEVLPNKAQQQAVSPFIVRLNNRLRPLGFDIRPGVARRTYRLRALSPATAE
jgi:hypothetical protein